MADIIELVIKIPEEQYNIIKSNLYDTFPAEMRKWGLEAIRNGTPLPKGHGRLKDEDEIVKAIEDRVEFLRKNDATFMRLRKDIDIIGCIPKIRCGVPTIIEPDKEYEVEVITRGNCVICGKELTEGLLFCKECGDKVNRAEKEKQMESEVKNG